MNCEENIEGSAPEQIDFNETVWNVWKINDSSDDNTTISLFNSAVLGDVVSKDGILLVVKIKPVWAIMGLVYKDHLL